MSHEQQTLKLKYSCGCTFVNNLIAGLRSHYLCPKHYKLVANHNAMHKIREAKIVKLKKPRWTLIE